MYDQLLAVSASLINGVKYFETPLTYHRIHDDNSHNSNIRIKIHSESNGDRLRLGFSKRKKQRVLRKIEAAESKLALIKNLLNSSLVLQQNSFRKHNAEKKFHYCFFNRTLYRQLVQVGIDKVEAKKISRGKLHYIFFRFF
jgi:hypothetical protein